MDPSKRHSNIRLPPEVNRFIIIITIINQIHHNNNNYYYYYRIIYVRNLPFKITSEEMYDIFGKYGAIRQIRLGTTTITATTTIVIIIIIIRR